MYDFCIRILISKGILGIDFERVTFLSLLTLCNFICLVGAEFFSKIQQIVLVVSLRMQFKKKNYLFGEGTRKLCKVKVFSLESPVEFCHQC